MTSATPGSASTWDLFCRVIDNHGDLGVCWRLARGLSAAGATVRLWVDDARALDWMAPQTDWPGNISVHPFAAADVANPSDVVVEAFGCDPPSAFVRSMAAKPEALRPMWINLEYLSAESYVERCHKLPSPQHTGAGAGLTKWFFYPGFNPRTGGLMLRRDTGADPGTASGPALDFLRELDVPLRPAARRISLFSYPNPGIGRLLCSAIENDAPPIDLLVAPGYPQQAVHEWLKHRSGIVTTSGGIHVLGSLRILLLPYLSQRRYDALLRTCDLNFVRGEDSLVSALDAGRPLVWHIYPQDDDAHRQKLQAFLDSYLDGADTCTRSCVRVAHRVWNGLAELDAQALQLENLLDEAYRQHASRVCERLRAGPELVQELIAFANARRERLFACKPS